MKTNPEYRDELRETVKRRAREVYDIWPQPCRFWVNTRNYGIVVDENNTAWFVRFVVSDWDDDDYVNLETGEGDIVQQCSFLNDFQMCAQEIRRLRDQENAKIKAALDESCRQSACEYAYGE